MSPGGWLIVDDFHIPACVQAVTEYREQHGITEEVRRVNWAACWRKAG
ncbi:MAG: TylF/MycF/NovP-related O-methyltransferase [Acidimicrobiales bacterium]